MPKDPKKFIMIAMILITLFLIFIKKSFFMGVPFLLITVMVGIVIKLKS